jgi:hypothetical protein
MSFELPPAHFASFLVGEPKAFPFVVRRRLPSVTVLLGLLTGDEGGLEFMVVRGREKRKGYQREGWRDIQRMSYTEEKGNRKAHKTLSWGKGGHFGKSQKKLSLPRLPIFPHFSVFVPSGLVLPFCGFGECCSRSRELGWEPRGD